MTDERATPIEARPPRVLRSDTASNPDLPSP